MIDVRLTLKSGVQMTGGFCADSLDEITLTSDWLHSDNDKEIYVKISQIAAMEVVSKYS